MIRVGKIVATHGLNGDVIITHITGKKNWLKKGDALFVAMQKGSHIPYFTTNIKNATADEIIVHLEDTDTVEAAKRLVGKEIFIDQAILAQSGNTDDSPLLWIGFTMYDATAGELGVIKDIYQTANQWLAEVNYNQTEVLIPLVKPVLDKVDAQQQKVFVILPDGLLEVYS